MTENGRFEVGDRVVVTASSPFTAVVGRPGIVVRIDKGRSNFEVHRQQIIRVRLLADGGKWDNHEGFWFASSELGPDVLGVMAAIE